jgi:hypothetical protein
LLTNTGINSKSKGKTNERICCKNAKGFRMGVHRQVCGMSPFRPCPQPELFYHLRSEETDKRHFAGAAGFARSLVATRNAGLNDGDRAGPGSAGVVAGFKGDHECATASLFGGHL